MKLYAAAVLALAASALLADRNISTPTAYTLQPGEFRLDYDRDGSDPRSETYAVFGVLPYVEVGLNYVDTPSLSNHAGVNVQYSVVQPYPDLLPGVSVGVLDLFNTTRRGRVVYAAATFQINLVERWTQRERINVTIGAGTNLHGAFFNLYWPMYTHVAFIADHDSRVLSVGIDLEPISGVAFRAVIQDNHPLYGIQIRRIF